MTTEQQLAEAQQTITRMTDEMRETQELAYQLIERAISIDSRLIAATNSAAPSCELGEVTRLRKQLERNRSLLNP